MRRDVSVAHFIEAEDTLQDAGRSSILTIPERDVLIWNGLQMITLRGLWQSFKTLDSTRLGLSGDCMGMHPQNILEFWHFGLGRGQPPTDRHWRTESFNRLDHTNFAHAGARQDSLE
jgi:hypothetical protein